jgi:hypothetical protein
MKTQSTRTKLTAMTTALIALAAVWAAWGASRAQALIAILVPGDGFGSAQGQTARLNIVNRGEERGIIIEWKIIDSQGHTLAEGPEPHLIPHGQMRSFDGSADELDAMRDRFGRIQIRAVVRAVGNPDVKRNPHISVEVIDYATGKTTAFIGNPIS